MAFRVLILGSFLLVGVQQSRAFDVGAGFFEEVQNVLVAQGSSAILPCLISSVELTDLSVTWLQNNIPLKIDDDSREILKNGSLLIRKVQAKNIVDSDAGEYRCIVQTNVGTITSAPVNLHFASIAHNFTNNPVNMTAAVGQNVKLQCHIVSMPPAEITWEHDGKPLPQNSNKYIPFQSGSILYIINLSNQDSGGYRCIAINHLVKEIRNSSSGFLTIITKSSGSNQNIEFLSPETVISEVQVSEGSNVSIACAVKNSTPLVWTFNISGFVTPKIESSNGLSIVKLTNVSEHDSGDYICSVMTATIVPRTVHVTVNLKPKLLTYPQSQSFYAARTIRLYCTVGGLPIPNVRWFKDGIPVLINGRIKHKTNENRTVMAKASELVLSSSVAQDSGLYQCMAENPVGFVWVTSKLYLNSSKAPPTPPSQVTCEALSSSEVIVKWHMESPTEIKGFSIHYSLTDGGEERQQVTPPQNRTSVVEKLNSFTKYTFSVRAYTDSASDFSEKVICLTGEDVPTAAPTITIRSTSPNSIEVSWKPLPFNLSHGVITEYKIQWKREGDNPSYKVDQVNGDVVKYVIIGLIPGQEYEVRVLGATKKGWPHLQLPWQAFQMPFVNSGLKVPSSPTVFLQALNSSSIESSWKLLDASLMKIIGYKAYIRPQNGHLTGPVILPANVTSYTFNNLESNTKYEILVFAFTKHGNGAVGVQSMYTPHKKMVSEKDSNDDKEVDDDNIPLESNDEDDSFEPPTGLEAEPRTSTSVFLKWKPSKNMLLSTTTAFICYNPVHSSYLVDLSSVHCINSSRNELLVENLNPYTWYEFKVMIRDNGRGISTYSETVECPTLEEVPSAVRSVHWKALNKSTILLTWQEPAALNGVLRNYTISYTEDDSLDLNNWKQITVPSNKYSAEIGPLKSKKKYKVTVRATTGAGFGPVGATIECIIDMRPSLTNDDSVQRSKESIISENHNLSIVLGLVIGLVFIILCIVFVLFRRYCGKNVRTGREITNRSENPGHQEPSEGEFEMLSRPRTNFSSSPQEHIDAKGGYYPNGVIGNKYSSGNTRLINGCTKSSTIHITNNPRYDPNSSESPILGLHSKTVTPSHPQCESSSSSSGHFCNESSLPLLNNTGDSCVNGSVDMERDEKDLKCSIFRSSKSEGVNFGQVKNGLCVHAGRHSGSKESVSNLSTTQINEIVP